MPSSPLLSKRQQIIQAATQLFLKHNFNAVSMDKIAQAAPVSKATLYKHFDSKHSLLVAVVDNLCQTVLHTIDTLPTDADAATVDMHLKQTALSFMNLIYSQEGLALYRLIIAECHVSPELGVLIYDVGPKKSLMQLENYLQSLNTLASFNITDSAFAANAFFGLLKGEVHFQCLLNIKAPPSAIEKQAYIDQIIPLYMQGFLHDAL